jgi:hypothetical protein
MEKNFLKRFPAALIKRAMRWVLTARKEKAVGSAHGLICSFFIGYSKRSGSGLLLRIKPNK